MSQRHWHATRCPACDSARCCEHCQNDPAADELTTLRAAVARVRALCDDAERRGLIAVDIRHARAALDPPTDGA